MQARAESLPFEALDLLNESTADSCSICAGKKRKEAFGLLADIYPPGTVLRSNARRHFVVLAGAEDLTLSDYDREQPAFTFRFHDVSDHLVGVAESDFTDSTLAATVRSSREFDGAIEVVAFEYGDGPSFHYSPSSNHLQVQCRVLEATPR